jgi:hypothetical protein
MLSFGTDTCPKYLLLADVMQLVSSIEAISSDARMRALGEGRCFILSGSDGAACGDGIQDIDYRRVSKIGYLETST